MYYVCIDVGRTIPCTKMEFNHTEAWFNHPEACFDPILNYILDFDYERWEPYLNGSSKAADTLLKFSEDLQVFMLFGTIPKQNVLFDLPVYYIGKYVIVLKYTYMYIH